MASLATMFLRLTPPIPFSLAFPLSLAVKSEGKEVFYTSLYAAESTKSKYLRIGCWYANHITRTT